MKLLLTKDPSIAIFLIPWYEAGDDNRFDIGTELHDRMKNSPDDTFVSVVIEERKVLAVLIAYVLNETDIFLWQAKANPKFKKSNEMFDMLIDWAKTKNKKRIIAITKRPKPAVRRYGFVYSNGVLTKEI